MTDRQTDRQTGRQTFTIAVAALHYVARPESTRRRQAQNTELLNAIRPTFKRRGLVRLAIRDLSLSIYSSVTEVIGGASYVSAKYCL